MLIAFELVKSICLYSFQYEIFFNIIIILFLSIGIYFYYIHIKVTY
nr:MAG TPA: hypothetical protein [Caudoviricetes sp.]